LSQTVAIQQVGRNSNWAV